MIHKKVRESSFNRLNSLTFYEPKAGLTNLTAIQLVNPIFQLLV